MPDIVHAAVRAYLAGLTPPEDDLAADVRRRSSTDGVPAISPASAWLLHVLTRIVSARRAFEVGTGYGLSGLAIGRALPPDGVLFSVERDAARAATARAHFDRAGLAGRVNVMVGEAARLVHKVAGPFDLILQDGSQDLHEALLDRLAALLRPGGVLVSDNVLRRGEAVPGFTDGPSHAPESTKAIARYHTRLAAHALLRTVFLPAGDGVAVSVRVEGTP